MAAVGMHEFFIVYIPKFSEDRLKIPDQFVQHMREKTSGSVYLTGPSGNTWTLQLMKNEDGLFFDKGWTTFVKDHKIQIGEFLIFKYDGKSGFGMVVFGYNACEKKSAFYARCSQPSGNVDFPKAVKAEVIEDSSQRTAVHSKFEEEEEPDTDDSLEHESDDQRPATTSSSKPPFFLVHIKKYHLDSNVVRIPSNFLKKNKLKYKHEDMIHLRNEKGQLEAVKVVGSQYRLAFSAGWRVFARNSGVKTGDVCMFELVGKYELLMLKIRNRNTPSRRHPHPQKVKIEISD